MKISLKVILFLKILQLIDIYHFYFLCSCDILFKMFCKMSITELSSYISFNQHCNLSKMLAFAKADWFMSPNG